MDQLSAAGRFCEDPARNVQRYFYRLWTELSGISDGQEQVESTIETRARQTAYPVGGGVLLAVLFLFLVALVLYIK